MLTPLWTPWGEKIAAGRAVPAGEKGLEPPSHPRPLLAREAWTSLNGTWECAFVPAPDAATAWRAARVPDGPWVPIRVPFSPEAPLSGVGRQLRPDELLWYRRPLDAPSLGPGDRIILHLDAVDWACAVYVNGARVAEHAGGYLPFSADVTDALRTGEKNELAVCVHDPSDAGTQLRGKQRLARGGIWYTAQSGIWRDVWYEVVPAAHVTSLAADARPVEGRVLLAVGVAGEGAVTARVLDGGSEVARAYGACPGWPLRARPRRSRTAASGARRSRGSMTLSSPSAPIASAATAPSARWRCARTRAASPACISTASPSSCAACSTRATGRTAS